MAKTKCRNPYQTNKGGCIQAPKKVATDEPKATVTTGKTDLRVKKGK